MGWGLDKNMHQVLEKVTYICAMFTGEGGGPRFYITNK